MVNIEDEVSVADADAELLAQEKKSTSLPYITPKMEIRPMKNAIQTGSQIMAETDGGVMS